MRGGAWFGDVSFSSSAGGVSPCALGVKLPPGKYATLGGFLLAKAGEIPKPDSVLKVGGLTFTIKRSTAQAIQEVRIQR